MTDEPRTQPAAPPALAWLRRFGWRNLAYLLFVALLIPFGLAMEASGPHGPDSGGGIMFALIIWGVASAVFMLVNAGLAIAALARGRPAGRALIACALPVAIVVGTLLLESITLR